MNDKNGKVVNVGDQVQMFVFFSGVVKEIYTTPDGVEVAKVETKHGIRRCYSDEIEHK
jgi:hypothetical protein